MSKQPVSEIFYNNVYVMPLWVKQVFYLKTRDRLRVELAEFMDVMLEDNLMQYYVPKLTGQGLSEFSSSANTLPKEFHSFIEHCTQEHDLFEITLSNYWTFAQTCFVFVRSVELGFIELPKNDRIYALAQFLAGRIRTGEILRKLGKIDIKQLDDVLRIQKDRIAAGRQVKIAELMIQLGLIIEKDIKILLAFKEDAKRRFTMGVGLSLVNSENQETNQTVLSGLQKEIKRLDEENRILKGRLRKLLNIN